jgi:prepilin-type processing-associated H-X9-DG protein
VALRLDFCIDENPTSINDGSFISDTDSGFQEWIDYPATYHNNASGITFADGHVEIHRWVTLMSCTQYQVVDKINSLQKRLNPTIWAACEMLAAPPDKRLFEI